LVTARRKDERNCSNIRRMYFFLFAFRIRPKTSTTKHQQDQRITNRQDDCSAVGMVCEEYKQLLSELNAARGEWIHFRLTADKRAAGMTDAKSKEMVSRAKDKMDEIKSRMLVHTVTCKICNNDRNDVFNEPFQRPA